MSVEDLKLTVNLLGAEKLVKLKISDTEEEEDTLTTFKSDCEKATSRDRKESGSSSEGSFLTESVTTPFDEQQVIQDWQKYWAQYGNDIINRTWLKKYQDYYDSTSKDTQQSLPEDQEQDISEIYNGIIDTDVENKNSFHLTAEEPPSSKESENEEPTSLASDTILETQSSCASINSLEERAQDEDEFAEDWMNLWQQHIQEVEQDEYIRFYTQAKELFESTQGLPMEIKKNPTLMKYWASRYKLFTKYDEGIKLDDESWFSVTPEKIAKHIAYRCSAGSSNDVIVDAFCGCGGNTIAFAKKFKKVIAIDIDPVKVEYAQNNARIYGVEDKIEFIIGNYMELAKSLVADVVFLSPPWGGPEYASAPIFDMKTMMPINGFEIFEITKNISSNIAYYLPRNCNPNQIMQLAGHNNIVEIEKNMFKRKVKANTAYYGGLINKHLRRKFLAEKNIA